MGPLNELARDCHAANQHWWHDPATGQWLDRNRGELYILMISEVTEAMEGERKDLMDTHLIHRKMAEVELADITIRIADYAGAYDLDLDTAVVAVALPDFPENKGEALLQIAKELVAASGCTGRYIQGEVSRLAAAILLVRRYAERHGYDLDGAISEKRAYNAVRADHQAEARLRADGKKW